MHRTSSFRTTFATRARRAALLGACSMFLAAPALAQDAAPRAAGEETTSLEVFPTQYWLDKGEAEERPTLGGYGARLSTNLGRAVRSNNAWFTRSALGAYFVYTAEQDDNETKTLHFGGQVDAHLLPRPFLKVLDPFVSAGVGGFRTTFTQAGGLLGGEEKVSNTDLTLVPGVGTHLHLTPNISVRGDLRDVVILGDKTTHNFEASAGISLNF